MDINKMVFDLIVSFTRGMTIVRAIHPALLLYIEAMLMNYNDTRGINEFALDHNDNGFILIAWMKERGFIVDDINAAILARSVKVVPVKHYDWPAIVESDARTLELLNVLIQYRRGVAVEEGVRNAIDKFTKES